MKSLTDEQKKRMWKDIEQAILFSSSPKEGEYTIEDLIKATGFKRNRMRTRLDRLLKAGILGKRKGVSPKGYPCNIYFPLKESSSEEILEVLTG